MRAPFNSNVLPSRRFLIWQSRLSRSRIGRHPLPAGLALERQDGAELRQDLRAELRVVSDLQRALDVERGARQLLGLAVAAPRRPACWQDQSRILWCRDYIFPAPSTATVARCAHRPPLQQADSASRLHPSNIEQRRRLQVHVSVLRSAHAPAWQSRESRRSANRASWRRIARRS